MQTYTGELWTLGRPLAWLDWDIKVDLYNSALTSNLLPAYRSILDIIVTFC